jgi:hydroxypyruvate reductase
MRELLTASFHAALAAVDPLKILPPHLPAPPKGRTLVVGAGKAAAAMALAVEQHWPQDAPLDGLVVTRYGHGLPTRRIRVVEAGHPLPDSNGESAARQILEAAHKLSEDDLLLCLISGGASSLLTLPAAGLTTADIRALTYSLLRCGANIQEINTVRKHLSAILGGRLAAATTARVLALIVSDVTGDDPSFIGSGPCAPDPTSYADALGVLNKYQIVLSPAVSQHLQRGLHGTVTETPKPGDPLFQRVVNQVIAGGSNALHAAAEYFRQQGITPVILGDDITGEAREVAKAQGELALQVKHQGVPWQPPVALISGGETSVTVHGDGKGGRNTAFLLALGMHLQGAPRIHAIACDTDGIDGTEDNAGAVLTPDTLARAHKCGLDAAQFGRHDDSYSFFAALDDLVMTGPTRTNVNDYRAILIL